MHVSQKTKIYNCDHFVSSCRHVGTSPHFSLSLFLVAGEVQLAAVREALKKAKGEAEKSIKLDNDVQERFQKVRINLLFLSEMEEEEEDEWELEIKKSMSRDVG